MTSLEKELIYSLAEVVDQNCNEDKDHKLFSGFIRSHKTAMQLLVSCGVMRDSYPGKQDDDPGRSYYAEFIDDWQAELRDRV